MPMAVPLPFPLLLPVSIPPSPPSLPPSLAHDGRCCFGGGLVLGAGREGVGAPEEEVLEEGVVKEGLKDAVHKAGAS